MAGLTACSVSRIFARVDGEPPSAPTVSNAWGGAGETLEDATADFALAQLARMVGDGATERAFLDALGVATELGVMPKPGTVGEKALLLLSHIDVVPAEAAVWRNPPFDGKREQGYIWGRGALDCKSLTIAEQTLLQL